MALETVARQPENSSAGADGALYNRTFTSSQLQPGQAASRRAEGAAATAAAVAAGTIPDVQLVDHNPAQSNGGDAQHGDFWSTAGSVISDLATGAYNEVTQHPLQVAEAAVTGLAIGVVAAAVAPEVAIAAGVAALAYGGYELATHAGGWAHDVSVINDSGSHSSAELAQAHADLQNAGAGATLVGAGLVGGFAAGPLTEAATGAISSLSGSAAADGTTVAGTSLDATTVSSADSDLATATTPATAPETTAATASETASLQSADAAASDSQLGSTLGTVNADGMRVLNNDETAALYDQARQANGELLFAKPEVEPGMPKYYQVEAHQVSLSDNPAGFRVGTTESPLSADTNIALANGETIPAGNLPTGVQVSGNVIHTPPDGVTLANGTVLKDGMTLPEGMTLNGGQNLSDGDWVITRNTLVDGKPGYDTYTNHAQDFSTRWRPVAGQPGQYSPKSVPTDMTFLPSGNFQIPTSWGTAKGQGPAFLAQYKPGNYNIITLKDATETGYLSNPLNDASRALAARLLQN